MDKFIYRLGKLLILPLMMATYCSQAQAVNLQSINADYVLSVMDCDNDDILIHLRSAGWVVVKPSKVGTAAARWITDLARELLLTGKQTGYITVDWTAAISFPACQAQISRLPSPPPPPFVPIMAAPISTFSATYLP